MPIRTKARGAAASRARTVAVRHHRAVRAKSDRANGSARRVATIKHSRDSAAPAATAYTKALRFLHSLSDYEKMRIVRYTPEHFNLERMRTLLKKLDNPQTA